MSLLLKASSLSVLAGLIAGCSSGFQRFDTAYYDSALPAQSSQNVNPYPGDGVDEITTSSVGSSLRPVSNVAPPVYDRTYAHAPEPRGVVQPNYAAQQRAAYSAPQTYKPYVDQANTSVNQVKANYQNASNSVRRDYTDYKANAQATYQRATSQSWNTGDVARSALSRPSPVEVAKSTISNSRFVKPTNTPSNLNYYTAPAASGVGAINSGTSSLGTDKFVTSSVKSAEPGTYKVAHSQHQMNDGTSHVTQVSSTQASSAHVKEANGWSSVGGTKITVRPGETLYNLSKRYGVPANAIQKVNGINSETSLQAGQQILIPNYVFSPSANVSAPDNDPRTRAARASTGMVGEANVNNVAVPTRRPYQMAAVAPSGEVPQSAKRRYEPKVHVINPEDTAPDYSIVTGSVSKTNSAKTYEVVSGDTLYQVFRKTGVSVEKLKEINNLDSDNIRIGQKLQLTGSVPVETAKVEAPVVKPSVKATEVDPVTTQAFKKTVRNLRTASNDSEAKAPASSGIGQFRWPVQGRVISKFGERNNEGIDISVPEGTSVKAIENGVVIYAGKEISSYGNLILVRHANDWVSAYAHNKAFNVKKGDRVTRGQTIAKSGKTGSATRPKVHFELRKASKPVDPMKHLSS